MIPYPYNMVDMGGIDLAEANRTVVPGIYDKILEAADACGDLVLYNWKFAGIEIAPVHTQILFGEGRLLINTLIQVTELDEITVLGIAPPVVPVSPLVATENRVYEAEPPASGFNPVTVSVPISILLPLNVSGNGLYIPSDYDADGFSSVNVNVSSGKYQEVTPDFFGLATAYQALNGSFYTENTKIQCLFIAPIESDSEYVVFLPEEVDNRFRAAKWPGKSIEDFSPYLDVTGTNTEIYSGGIMITPSNELSGDGLTRRFYFEGVNGSVVIGTSNQSELVKPILLKIQEV